MIDLSDLRLFVKVAEFGSFTRAAESLHVPKSNVSKAIARLERQSKTALLIRTTRSLRLTPAGQELFQSCLDPVRAIEGAARNLEGANDELTGSIRLTAPEDLGGYVIAQALAPLILQYPKLAFDLHYTDEIVDLVRDDFDLAIRVGRLRESRLRLKKLGEIRLVLVATKQYLRAKPRIRSPHDLEKHSCLSISVRGASALWNLYSKKETMRLRFKPQVVSNQMTSLLRLSRASAGIALVPHYLCREDIESGELVRVLPEWSSTEIPVSLLTALPTSSSVKLKRISEEVGKAVTLALNSASSGRVS